MGGCAGAGRSGQASMARPAARADAPGEQRDPQSGRDQLADAGRAVRLERDAGLEPRRLGAPARMPRSPLPAGRHTNGSSRTSASCATPPANAYRPGGVASTTLSAASGWPR